MLVGQIFGLKVQIREINQINIPELFSGKSVRKNMN